MAYTKVREIGRGGYGIVELVTGEDGAEYAMKTLNYGTLNRGERAVVRKRFEREIRYQGEINHQNVVTIESYDLQIDPPWFVMPLAANSLADDLSADKTLAGDPQKTLFDILAGLEALHQKGFCHRDLKPANVLKYVERQDVYKISDFGLMTPGAGQTTTLTGSNMQGGTVMYRPPECANNFRRATAHADIYSFGAILHDIFSAGVGRVPHSELTVPGALGRIVEKCTKSQPRCRYGSIADLREALFEVLSDEVVEFFSQEEEHIISILKETDDLTDEQWDRAFNLIDDNADKDISNYNLMRALRLPHIQGLFDAAPDMFIGLGEIYATFASSFNFAFEYADVVSDKAQLFYDLGDLKLKAQIVIAMLELGVTHNRWQVEHQFMRMVGNEIGDALADRIRIEMQVQGTPFQARMDHLERSIPVSRNSLHPILLSYLDSCTQ